MSNKIRWSKSLGTRKVVDNDKVVLKISPIWLTDKHELSVVWKVRELYITFLDAKTWDSIIMWLQQTKSMYQKEDIPGVTNKTKELEVLVIDHAKACFKVLMSTWLRSSSKVEEATVVLWAKAMPDLDLDWLYHLVPYLYCNLKHSEITWPGLW